MDQLRPRWLRTVRSNQTGLTLVEVMVALGVLAFGLLAMLTMQIHALRTGRLGRHYTQAAQVARDRMELFHRLPWTDPQVQDTGGWVIGGDLVQSMVQVGGGGGAALQEQAFTVDWRIQDVAATNLRLFDVRVTWREPSDRAAMAARRYAISSQRWGQ